MPVGPCLCGRQTNSVCSNWWRKRGKPTECYAALDGNQWVKGCKFDKLEKDSFERKFAQDLITRGKKTTKGE